MQRVHADLGAQRIEIGVRRHHDGLVHIGHAIGGAAGVAELLAAELVVAGIGNAVGGAALAQFQRGQADEGLVGRTDGIGAVQRAVDQRMVGRLVQHAPVVHVDAVDEEIGIERGLRHEGQHLACIGIQRHQRAALPSKACSATFCRPMSMDSMMSEPGTGSMRRSVRMGRPPAVTSTSSRPVRPCSASSQVFSMPFLPITSVPR